jgi:hypothetical protein
MDHHKWHAESARIIEDHQSHQPDRSFLQHRPIPDRLAAERAMDECGDRLCFGPTNAPAMITTHDWFPRSMVIAAMLAFMAPHAEGQIIRGQVVDADSRISIPGAHVILHLDSGMAGGVVTDETGRYRLVNVPIGRVNIEFRSMGHTSVLMRNILVTSGREVVLDVELHATMTGLEEFEIIGERANEMSVLGVRQFTVEETERFAGSRGDPGRMAASFAGVQGADDSRNDIIIRGNSPQGLLWRFEGVDIPNPNHFAIPGTGGGPVTILNNKYLANSELHMGAFPAEFGNAIGGVFDLRMRNGNSERHEVSAQLGFLGTELMVEGPLGPKGGASYLLSYRYSTLQLFGTMGINVGTDAIPKYQDAAFRIGKPLGRKGHLAFWGIGGASDIDIVLSSRTRPDTTTLIYGDNDRDQYFDSRMAVIGTTWSQTLSEKTHLRTTFAAAHSQVGPHHDYIYRHVENGNYVVDSLPAMLGYRFREDKLVMNSSIVHKAGARTTFKAGLIAEGWQLEYRDSARAISARDTPDDPLRLDSWRTRWDAQNRIVHLRPYVQMKRHLGRSLVMTTGLHSAYASINRNSMVPLEPRVGFSMDLGAGRRIALGYGLHSQLQPGYLYFYRQDLGGGEPREQNRAMGPTRSHHLVLGHDRMAGRHIRLRTEVYYQYLFNIPVSVEPSAFSLVNTGAGFERYFPDSLQNTGTGRNVGLEATLEHAFRRGYYFLITGSLFDARYRGSDGIWRNTTFNGRYAANALFAREFTTKRGSVISIGARSGMVGGRWHGPVDREASDAAQQVVYLDQQVNTIQFRPYFRTDLKLGYRWNRTRVMHEFNIDIVNITNHQNILTLTYAPGHVSGEPVREEYQLGTLPIFYYRLEF